MLKKILAVFLLVTGYWLLVTLANAEDFTITTYYPSPYGSYNQLQTNSLGVGDNNNSGGLDSGDVPPTAGDVWIKGEITITGGSPVSGRVLTSTNATGLASWQPAPSVPSGAIMFFNGNCPTGWTEFTSAQGRYIVGLVSGGIVGSIAGTAFTTSTEVRPAGLHQHPFTTGVAGAHIHPINDPGHWHQQDLNRGYAEYAGGGSPSHHHDADFGTMNWVLSKVTGITILLAGDHSHPGTTNFAGTDSTPAPYIQLRACQAP